MPAANVPAPGLCFRACCPFRRPFGARGVSPGLVAEMFRFAPRHSARAFVLSFVTLAFLPLRVLVNQQFLMHLEGLPGGGKPCRQLRIVQERNTVWMQAKKEVGVFLPAYAVAFAVQRRLQPLLRHLQLGN